MTRFVSVPVGQGGLSCMGIGSERAGCNDPRGPGARTKRRRRRMATHSGCSRHAASWPARLRTFWRHVDKQNNTTPPKPHTVSLYTTTHARRSAAKKKRTRARATRRRHIPSSPCFSNSSGCLVIRKVGPSAGPPRRQLTNRAAIPRCFHRGKARRGRRAAHIQHSGIGHRRTAR